MTFMARLSRIEPFSHNYEFSHKIQNSFSRLHLHLIFHVRTTWLNQSTVAPLTVFVSFQLKEPCAFQAKPHQRDLSLSYQQ